MHPSSLSILCCDFIQLEEELKQNKEKSYGTNDVIKKKIQGKILLPSVFGIWVPLELDLN